MTTEKPNVQTSAGQAALKEMGVIPIPLSDTLTSGYWDAANKHELRIQRCTNCGLYRHPPRRQCTRCWSKKVEWAKLSGKGTVYSFIIDHRNMVPGFEGTYAVAQVNPDEAQLDTVRITANIRGCEPHDVYIGMPVEVIFEERKTGVTLPYFRPSSNAKIRSRG